MFNNENKLKIFGKGVFFFFMAVIFIIVMGAIVMWLWNAILPEVTGVKQITYWQAVGLLVLSRILFGGFGGGRHKGGSRWKDKGRGYWKRKMASMDDDQKERMKEKWEAYCNKKND